LNAKKTLLKSFLGDLVCKIKKQTAKIITDNNNYMINTDKRT